MTDDQIKSERKNPLTECHYEILGVSTRLYAVEKDNERLVKEKLKLSSEMRRRERQVEDWRIYAAVSWVVTLMMAIIAFS